MPKLWQIACGSAGRDYSPVFLKHDVMLIGPGTPGRWGEADYSGETRMSPQIRSFAEDPRPGDLILLRNGRDVLSVGRIPDGTDGDYFWCGTFGDVLGWDLQHARRVLWSDEACRVLDSIQPVFHNVQQRSFHEVHEDRIRNLMGEMDTAIEDRPLRPLPPCHEVLELDDVGSDLFAAGVSNDSVEHALAAIRRARRLREWYSHSGQAGERPKEVEAVTHMVVPLMTGLGWSEQLLAVEWKRIDLAFFRRTPTVEGNCAMICEAKSPGYGLDEAFGQAKEYVARHGLVNCTRILATDGTLYLVYDGPDWPKAPTAYVNLQHIQEESILPGTAGALQALRSMIPALVTRG